MLKQLLEMVLAELNKKETRDTSVDRKILSLINEIDELEEKLAKAMEEAERWGDLSDSSDWRTAKVNKIKRMIEAKQRMIETLKRF